MEKRGDPIIVIGGGAAGIVAAWRAASLGADVMLLERNGKLGIKLLISGGGKCNITHAGSREDTCAAFVPREARFLKPSFFRFSYADIIRMVEDRGVRTSVRPNGRIFPASGRAADVVEALTSFLHSSGVVVRLHSRVEGITVTGHSLSGVVLAGKIIRASHIVLATGGASYPKTGTTGDGYTWAKHLGHTVVPLRPALAPFSVSPPLPAEWRGVAIRGGSLMAFAGGRKLCERKDDILFTHEGVSGPAALEASRIIAESMAKARVVDVRFDFFPEKDFACVDAEVNDLVQGQKGKMVATLLEGLLPNRIIPRLLQSAGVDPLKRGHVLTRDERRSVVRVLKEWRMGTVSHISLERGEVTAGGIALDEVDPQTMRSRKVRGLYVCGEVLDVAGPVGGYNLQAAFSTGYVAGETAARDWLAAAGSANHHQD